MAVRSGAGTGVVVSLVVFVITTVFLLVLTIVFYAGRAEALEERANAESALSRYVQPAQRNQDLFRGFEAAASERNQSVAQYLHNRIENIMRYVDGDGSTRLENLQGRLTRFGVDEDGVVVHALQDTFRERAQAREELESLRNQMERLNNDLTQLRNQNDQLRASQREELQSVQQQIAGYRDAADDYRRELDNTRRAMNESVDRLHNQYEGRVAELTNEIDAFNRERVLLMSRIDDLQARLSADRIRAQDPATLVDGRIIDASGSSDQVFIDRGRRHRIVLGMTFEVYDDAAAIRVNPQTGELPRGKASLQVIRVGDTTSTAKIVRSVPGRPVVRDDVIANAVYDPNYQFKFLVHGLFDIDGDGRATASEREYIENKIIEWGGIVVQGDELPGDLDFLVLGVRPQEPPLLPQDATQAMIRDWIARKEAKERYEALFRQAREAQIPVLNANRFFILTGHTLR
jgi:biopolymer transport protein ExbB/TolQ